MRLTDKERQALRGEKGEAVRIAAQVLVNLGEAYDADSLVPIASAHVVACSYQIAGEAGIDIYTRLAEAGARVCVPTTLDPSSIDFDRWRFFRTPPDYAERQNRLAELLEQIGVIPTWTCTPYYSLNVPHYGQHLGWSESSAVVFANSVIGARTNRLAAYVDLCAGLLGKVPRFGLHLTENRRGQILIELAPEVADNFRDEDFPVLGYLVGEIAQDKIPVIQGITEASFDQLKAFGAASASTGAVALYHIIGLTPEARDLDDAFQGEAPERIVRVRADEMAETRARMSTFHSGEVDLVALGCPHASIDQVRRYVDLLAGRRPHPETQLWICMGDNVKKTAAQMGYLEALEASGAQVMTGTCVNDCPLNAWNFRTLVTDSAKFTYYTPTTVGVNCHFGSTEECIDAAVRGSIGN